MTLAKMLKQICKEMDVSLIDLANLSNQSYQNLSKKIRNETLSFKEFTMLTELLNVRFDYTITLPDANEPLVPIDNIRTKEKIDLLMEENYLLQKKVEVQNEINKDIRTSLDSIIGGVEIGLKHLDDKDLIAKYLKQIQKEGRNIDLLLYDGIGLDEADGVDVALEKVDPAFFKEKNVMVVEDNELNRSITVGVLEDNGFNVAEATNGLEALNIINKNGIDKYDYVIMDLEMPIMDGYDATKIIKKLDGGKELPIIALSANVTEDVIFKAKESGIDCYLAKPIDTTKLLKAMYKLGKKGEF